MTLSSAVFGGQLVSGLVEQRVKHATLETWAQAAITRRRDLTLGIQVRGGGRLHSQR